MKDKNVGQYMHSIFSAFPIPVGFYTLTVDNYEIVNYMETLDYNRSIGSSSPDADIYLSKSQKVLNDLPELKRIFTQKMYYHIKDIYEWNTDFQFTKSWVTKCYPGGFSQTHEHANSLLSGTYYPFGHAGFSIMIKSPLPNFWDVENINAPMSSMFSAKEITFKTADNLLIIFPSYLQHKVMPNKSKDIRYSLAFNVFPKGKISKDDTEITIGKVS